jgi:uncharacterized protein (DUF1800 family)
MQPIPDNDISTGEALTLTPYTGPWTRTQAAHLLRRTLFGATREQIQWSIDNGLNATVTQLMTTPPPTYPLAYSADETITTFGETWINDFLPETDTQVVAFSRLASLFAWTSERIFTPIFSIQEKMTLFWQNHFAATHSGEPRMAYVYINLLRTNCLGNFRQLVKDITIDAQMLVFLNGSTNNRFSPNENYARELFELYTIGKGPQIGEGDYTNYTEHDISEAAKVLTGWTIQNFAATTADSELVSSFYYPILHDDSTKTLSDKFGNAVITNANENEYAQLIDIIFQQDEVARFICRKLYRWFVNYEITSSVESTIIQEMATQLIADNYNIQPTVELLLKSEHFYTTALLGTIIKNPIEFLSSLYSSTTPAPNFNLSTNYQMYLTLGYIADNCGMNYYEPPQVAGWTAYYQQPGYSQTWINAALIKKRVEYSYYALYNGLEANGNQYPIDVLGLLDSFEFPMDADQVILELDNLFCCKPLSTMQKTFLKGVLTAQQGNTVWTNEYNTYAADPSNTSQATLIANQMKLTLLNLFKMPEFHIN